MEKIIEHGILYDFYGPLLTKHQQEVYEASVFENMSLSEIADEYGISRQGVHDLVKRCDKILEDYEAKLGLVKRFDLNRKKLSVVVEKVDSFSLIRDSKELQNNIDDIKKIIEEIREDL